jgi:hypothetical protein
MQLDFFQLISVFFFLATLYTSTALIVAISRRYIYPAIPFRNKWRLIALFVIFLISLEFTYKYLSLEVPRFITSFPLFTLAFTDANAGTNIIFAYIGGNIFLAVTF